MIQIVNGDGTDHFEAVSLCIEVHIERNDCYEIFLTVDEWYPVKFRNDGGVLIAIIDHTRRTKASHGGWLVGELHAGQHEHLVKCTVLCIRPVPSECDSATVVIRCVDGPHIGQWAGWLAVVVAIIWHDRTNHGRVPKVFLASCIEACESNPVWHASGETERGGVTIGHQHA